MQFNQDNRELSLKVVYYGPALSGKTTNLTALHARLNAEVRGRLLTVDTKSDRTLFFDLLPVFFETGSGLKVKIKLYTVPGQVMHSATRRIVLQGADAVAFIADSQREMTRANNEYWRNMQDDLRLNGLTREKLPTVIQFNKRDLPNVRSLEELEDVRRRGEEPMFLASALRGEGAALNSMHCYAKAADITIPGVPVWHLGRVKQYLHAGGVGFYPSHNFVHIDTGTLRAWSG